MFSIIRTGLDAANKDLAVISNNIANAGTNGFKKSEAQFEDLYHSQHNNSAEKATGMGVRTIKPRQSFAQGSLQATNGSLDLAIMGEGFFVLGQPLGRGLNTTPEERAFTRDGSFQLDREGILLILMVYLFLELVKRLLIYHFSVQELKKILLPNYCPKYLVIVKVK